MRRELGDSNQPEALREVKVVYVSSACVHRSVLKHGMLTSTSSNDA